MSTTEPFDVLLSFAGKERQYARAIHDIAVANGVSVFLDEEQQAEIWGSNLIEYLHETYRNRGRFVVVLISAAYSESAYTKVERRAALDRLINQDSEFVLPVLVDDTWIPGLPKSTAYLDIRRVGVLGIAKVLVEKVLQTKHELVIPAGLQIPRVPNGTLPSDQLSEHLIALCAHQSSVIFGALIYDETTVALRTLLTDQASWDALDVATGPDFELFAIRDQQLRGSETTVNIGLATAMSMHRSQDKTYYYSRLLKEYFGEDKTTLSYPSVLLFIVSERRVRKCWLIPGRRRSSLEETRDWLIDLCLRIRDSLHAAGGRSAPNDRLIEALKTDLLAHEYTLYIQDAPTDSRRAVEGIAAFVHRPQ